jgi:TonB family protein
MAFSIQTPLGYSIAGSIFLHIILVSTYGPLFTPGEMNPPPPPKKFNIEMVVKNPKPIKKVEMKKKKIIRQKKITPVIIKKPHPVRSAQKVKIKEIVLQPVPRMVLAKPKKVQDQKIHFIQKTFQMSRADISFKAVDSKPRKIVLTQPSKIIHSKVPPSSTVKATPADFSPQPRLVKNVATVSTFTGKEINFRKSPVGFAPPTSRPKIASEIRISAYEGRSTARIHDGRKIMALGMSRARTVAVNKTQGMEQKSAVAFKSGASSRLTSLPKIQKRTLSAGVTSSIAGGKAVGMREKTIAIVLGLSKKRTFASDLASVTTPIRATELYETKTRPVSTFPSARVSTPPSSRISGSNKKTGFVQKGDWVASATFPNPRPVPDIVDDGILDGYLGALQMLIASTKKYPESARKSGQEGKVTIQFTVLKNGAVKNIQLLSKTNYPELNEEAIAAVQRAAPFSGLPDEIGKSFLEIILPFNFKLNE